MRSIVTLLGALLLFPTVVLGRSLYVRDNTSALVRTGPSEANKILVILKPGQEVSLVREERGYYVVATPNGTQGYVLKYLLTDQSPAEARPKELEQKTQQRISELETQTQEQEKELAALREERGRLEDAKKQAEVMASQQAERVSQLQLQHDTDQKRELLYWFLAGAGVLLTGFIFGWIWGATSRRHRRSGLSMDRL
jgi:SH3 domain protein